MSKNRYMSKAPAARPLDLTILEADDAALRVVGEQVDQPVGALANVADPVAVDRVPRLVGDAALGDSQANEPTGSERADEEIAAPVGEGAAGVERRARRRDDRIPVIDGLLHAGLGGALAD